MLTWGDREIGYALERVPRKTLAITVKPCGAVVVRAPLDAAPDAIETIVRKRASWILRQQHYFAQFRPRTTPREYIGGETHLYLGRRYRLRVRQSETAHVALLAGYLCVFTPEPAPPAERVKSLLDAWYAERGPAILSERFAYCRQLPMFADLDEMPLAVRRLRLRWGSCAASGRITLNTDLVRAPRACIDYVIIHELCHRIHHNHSRDFYRALAAVLPDWKERKSRLEQLLS